MYKCVDDSSKGKPGSFNHGILFSAHTYTSKMTHILGRKESRFLYTKVNSPIRIIIYSEKAQWKIAEGASNCLKYYLDLIQLTNSRQSGALGAQLKCA